jgi:hypothetical protein
MPRVSSHFGLQDPRLQSLLFETLNIANVTADANVTLTTDQVLGGWIMRSGMGAARTDTLPTAAQLCEAVQGCAVNLSFAFRIRNVNAGAFAQTLAVGAGGTLAAGNTATTAQTTDHAYRIVFTNVTPGSEAYTLYSLGQGGAF